MNLPAELLQQIKEAIASGALQLGNPDGRSPIRPRQLHDLTLLPAADDPRPTFFWSAEKPRNVPDMTKTSEYPRLMWHGTTGTEIAVKDRAEQLAHLSMGYVLTAPHSIAIDPLAELQSQFDAMPEADRALLVQSIQQDRINQLRAQLGSLPAEQLESLLANATQAPTKKGKVA